MLQDPVGAGRMAPGLARGQAQGWTPRQPDPLADPRDADYI
jgi:hypothetical protein